MPKTCNMFSICTLRVFHQAFLPNSKIVSLPLFYLRPNYAIVIAVTINEASVDKKISSYLSV